MQSSQLQNKIHQKKKEGKQIRNQRESRDQKKNQRKVLQHMLPEIKKNRGGRVLLPFKENPQIKTNIGIFDFDINKLSHKKREATCFYQN